jgi:hypothetical protein
MSSSQTSDLISADEVDAAVSDPSTAKLDPSGPATLLLARLVSRKYGERVALQIVREDSDAQRA